MALRRTAQLVDVSLRDGIQREPVLLSLSKKIEVAKQLVKSGLRRIEIGSFVSKQHVPQMANLGSVLKEIGPMEDTIMSVLVPNEHGFDSCLENGVQEVSVLASADEEFCAHQLNATFSSQLEDLTAISHRAHTHGIRLRGAIACAFSPFHGSVVPHPLVPQHMMRTVWLARTLLEDLGCAEVVLADTQGLCGPSTIASFLRQSEGLGVPMDSVAFHGHNTLGLGLANVKAAWDMGVSSFDCALAGLGGCPAFPDSGGNVSTEEAHCLFTDMGIETGVDLTQLCQAAIGLTTALEREQRGTVCRVVLDGDPRHSENDDEDLEYNFSF